MMVCHCLRHGGRKNCCKGNWWEGSKVCISAAAGFLSIINTEGQMKIFFMTTVGVVVTMRGRERVKRRGEGINIKLNN